MPMRRLVVAGTHSGVGKTTVALGLMAALRQRGLTVQPFKIGPDFIDPGHHTAVCGRVSRNLDTWMLSDDAVRATFARASAGADIAVVEGVMGLFDGRGPDDFRGSTANVAKLLDAPVLLVVDASAMAASVAALVKGFREFDPQPRFAGVLCNRVAGPRHYEYLEPALRRHTDVTPLGWLPRREEWKVAERHLGLTTTGDLGGDPKRWDDLGKALAGAIDLERLLEATQGGENQWSSQGADAPRSPAQARKRVAVARDAAFCFYYPENLELLEAAGAEIVPFSPLADDALPERIQMLYLGGGYPELHASTLAANRSLRESIQEFHARGGVIYAECGGLMACCRELHVDGVSYPMLDLLPARTIMQTRRAALGYVTLRTTHPSPLGPAGTEARGHEFHYSRLEPLGDVNYSGILETSRGDHRPDGLVSGNLYAGYAHLHFGSNPGIAAALSR